MKAKVSIVLLVIFSMFMVVSCKTPTNAQRATKIAKKRYKYIKHDCNCHSYLYELEDTDSAEI